MLVSISNIELPISDLRREFQTFKLTAARPTPRPDLKLKVRKLSAHYLYICDAPALLPCDGPSFTQLIYQPQKELRKTRNSSINLFSTEIEREIPGP